MMSVTENELSDREQEILRLLATGVSNKEIASQLFISPNTVKVHLRNIFTKIGVNSRTEAVLYAINTRLVDISSTMEATPSAEAAIKSPEVSRKSAAKNPKTVVILLAVLALAALTAAAFLFWRSRQPVSDQPTGDPANTPQWTILSPMPTARYGLAAVASENLIYTIAGHTGDGPSGSVERYDPAADHWTKLASKKTPVFDVGAVVLGGKIYVPGGKLAADKATSVLEIYDPRQDTWEVGPPMPMGLSAYAIVAFEGKIYLFGGWDGKRYQDSVLMFDPDTSVWQEKSHLPSPRGYAGATAVGGKIYILGGYDGKTALDSNLIYMPDREAEYPSQWLEGEPMPVGRYGMGVAGLADIIEVVGGIQNNGKKPSSLTYLAIKNTWQDFRLFSEGATAHFGLVPLGNLIFIVGGEMENQPTNQMMSYQAIYIVTFPIIR